MAKRKKSSKHSGNCAKRDMPVLHNNLCDLYAAKRIGKFKVCCRNCNFYSKLNGDNKEISFLESLDDSKE